LTGASRARFLHNVVRFDKYSVEQLYDIIRLRAYDAMKDGVVCEEVLSMIADISSPRGDARYALELLWRLGSTPMLRAPLR